MIRQALYLSERGFIPDFILKKAVYYLSKSRFSDSSLIENKLNIIKKLSQGDIAESTNEANEQHYEVPPDFFKHVLGSNLKYSCSLFDGTQTLSKAEEAMLSLYIERAKIKDNQKILDLGCGWGSFSLYIARKFPSCQITSVSNSKDQIDFINKQAQDLNLSNLTAHRQDVNSLNLTSKYDRIVSIEMFEHVRNYKRLLAKLSHHLADQGKVFVHIFCHKELAYLYEQENDSDWMTKYFFQGGIMPSADIFSHFNDDLIVKQTWQVEGIHYSKTSHEWLKNLDNKKKEVLELFSHHYPNPLVWFHRWRIFFLTCEVFFAINNGSEYFVSHYLLEKKHALNKK